MINIIKSKIKLFIFFIASLVYRTRIGKFAAEKFISLSMNNVKEVFYNDCNLKFVAPNSVNRFRIDTFASKEPETLNWIDSFEKKAVFWDIGANTGLYSCYAAKRFNCKVYAFEPSIFNLELLCRNIFLNQLIDKVTIIPIPLTEKLLESKLNMSNTDLGGAQSTFGQNYTYDGSELKKQFDYKTIGVSMDQAISSLQLSQPDHIKIDVDGIEHLILKGGANTLQKVKSLLVEVDEKFEIQKNRTSEYLTNAGFELLHKKNSKMFDNTKYDLCFNQIWRKN